MPIRVVHRRAFHAPPATTPGGSAAVGVAAGDAAVVVAATGGSAAVSFAAGNATVSTGGGSGESYWQASASVTHGKQLDPSAWRPTSGSQIHTAKDVGIPVDASGNPLFARSSDGGGTLAGGTTWTDVDFTGTVTAGGDNITFTRCKFTASGYVAHSSNGSSGNVFIQPSNQLTWTSLRFIDCEFYGGNSTGVVGGQYFERCYFTEGNDCFNARGSSNATTGGLTEFVECVFDGCLRTSPDSHSDIIQTVNTNNRAESNPCIFDVNLARCWVNAHNRWTADKHNAAFQSGGYGTWVGLTGVMEDNLFDGGNNTLGGSPKDDGTPTWPYPGPSLRRNRFGRLGDGSGAGTWAGECAVFDSTNVWDDTGLPVL